MNHGHTDCPAHRLAVAIVLLILPVTAAAGGKLIGTGGATQIEGAAGGGIVPWALLGGYGTEDENGATAFFSSVDTGDYRLDVIGAGFVWNNRVEISFARQDFDTGSLATAFPTLIAPDARIGQDVFGAKFRLTGDTIYGRWPQVALGIQHKRNRDFAIADAVGARNDTGTDVYLSVGRLLLAGLAGRNVYLNGTVRSTRANELGLLGFGGPDNDGRELVAEASAAVFLDRRTAIGVEYRQKPDNLAFADESDWSDVFIAWFPNKNLSLTAAWTDLGSIATLDDQRGLYFSAEAAF
jgi:hypothetical protein